MEEPPADLDRCLAILLLRTADRSQDMVSSILHCHKSVVGNVERWFTNTEELGWDVNSGHQTFHAATSPA